MQINQYHLLPTYYENFYSNLLSTFYAKFIKENFSSFLMQDKNQFSIHHKTYILNITVTLEYYC